MRRHEIESWALDVVERAQSKQPIEDSRVELKAQWPDDVKKAARRIAAHANAARGEPILWIIGVDEQTGGITGTSFSDFAGWYNSVRAQFDELAPEPVSLNIPIGSLTVTALFFETEAAPFVVKNSEGGAVQREVPWREATGVRSATRSQLLRLLSPLEKLPRIETVASFVRISTGSLVNRSIHWQVFLALFLTQPAGQESVFPSHRCEIVHKIRGQEPQVSSGVNFYGCGARNIIATDSFISVQSSGLFEIRSSSQFIISNAEDLIREEVVFAKGIEVTLNLYSATAERYLTLGVEFEKQKFGHGTQREWEKGLYRFDQRPTR